MPIIQPDTSSMLNMGPIAPGTYKAKIDSVEFQTSKKGGNPMIVPTFSVTVDGEVRPRKAYLVIVGEGAYGFDQLLRAVGLAGIADQYADKNQKVKPEFDTDNLIGQELNVIVDQELYNGEMKDRIKSFLKA